MTTSNFLHRKNIKSMIVVLVIVLGKVLSPEEINIQHQHWSNKIRNLPFTCPNKLHSWKTGIKNIFGQRSRWINKIETTITSQHLKDHGFHPTCIRPTLHRFHFGQLECQEENLFHTLESIIHHQQQQPLLQQQQSLPCSTVPAVICHHHVGTTPHTFLCHSNA